MGQRPLSSVYLNGEIPSRPIGQSNRRYGKSIWDRELKFPEDVKLNNIFTLVYVLQENDTYFERYIEKRPHGQFWTKTSHI